MIPLDTLTDSFHYHAAAFSDEMLYLLDTEGQQIRLNPAGYALQEIPDGADCRRPFLSFVHEEDRLWAQEALRSLQNHAPVERASFRVVGLCGTVTWVENRFHPLTDANGTTIGWIGIARDITEQRKLLDQLHQSQRLDGLGFLASHITHDVNNMLCVILGFTELLIEEQEENAPALPLLQNIQTGTERASALAYQINLYTRRNTTEFKPVAVSKIVGETMQMLRAMLPKNIRLQDRTSDLTSIVLCDLPRVQQVLLNLCLNARDAMPQGGTLILDAETLPATGTESEQVRLRIQDTGTGIPPETLANIWKPFYTTKPVGQGTGLGLSVVQQIMAMHNGKAEVVSEPGHGTTFYLTFPSASRELLSEAKMLMEPPGGDETLLVVDDEPMLLTMLGKMLSSKGYRVLTAENADDALQQIEVVGDRIDLFISDNMMPGMSGRQMAMEIRRRRPDAGILMCSGFTPARESEREISLPQDERIVAIQKPYQRRELLTHVRRLLDTTRRKHGG